MTVTGYQLREALRKWVQRQDMAKKVFENSKFAFAGEHKDITAAASHFFKAGVNVALLQAAQQAYNQLVPLDSPYLRMTLGINDLTLAIGVKLIGHAGCFEKAWRNVVSGPTKKPFYGDDDRRRSKDDEFAQPTIGDNEALAHAEKAGSIAAQLRAAIATANGTSIDLNLDLALFAE